MRQYPTTKTLPAGSAARILAKPRFDATRC